MKTLSKKELIAFEEDIGKSYNEGKIKAPIHLSGGNESQLIDIFSRVNENDWVFTNYRGHYHALLKGMSPKFVKEEILDGRSMYLSSPKHKFYSSCIVGGQLPIALGAALGIKLKGSSDHVWTFCGDMAAETTPFHECVQYAEGHDLPITFVVEDNGLGVYTETEKVWGKRAFPKGDENPHFVDLSYNLSNQSKVLKYNYHRLHEHHGVGVFVDFKDDESPNPEPFFKERVREAMYELSQKSNSIFLGQTVGVKGSPIFGSLEGVVNMDKRIELPIMEEVQMGISTGLSLEGFLPISLYPRWDFLLSATNQLVGHLDKMAEFTNGNYNPKVIIRTMVGSNSPLRPGAQHIGDYTEAFKGILKNTNVIKLEKAKDVVPTYLSAMESNRSSLIVEHADFYKPI